MTAAAEKKQLVLHTWEAFRRGDPKAAFANMTDDVTWWIPGAIPGVSGLKRGKAEILGFLRWAARTFPAGFRSEVRAVHADGDTVVLELVNRATSDRGRPYENEYCFVFELAGAKIRAVREYVDTQKVLALLDG